MGRRRRERAGKVGVSILAGALFIYKFYKFQINFIEIDLQIYTFSFVP